MSLKTSESMTNLTILGGGGGASTIIGGMVRHLPEADAKGVICVSDDGGSTGELVRQFETMPVGDVRRNIGSVAITAAITDILNYRFGSESNFDELKMVTSQIDTILRRDTLGYDERRVKANLEAATKIGRTVEGGLRGHTYGNFLLTGLATEKGFLDAVDEVSDMVEAKAKIIPVTTVPHTLMMYDGRENVRNEHNIDTWKVYDADNAYIWLEPTNPATRVEANPAAIEAIEQADLAIISPGSPYTSIAPTLAVQGVAEALQTQQELGGQLIAIANLENQPHDTADWCVGRYAQFIQRYIGRRAIDTMIYNNAPSALPDPQKAVAYDPELIAQLNLATIPLNLVGTVAVKNKNDNIKRADVYHDTQSLAHIIRLDNIQHQLGRTAFYSLHT